MFEMTFAQIALTVVAAAGLILADFFLYMRLEASPKHFPILTKIFWGGHGLGVLALLIYIAQNDLWC